MTRTFVWSNSFSLQKEDTKQEGKYFLVQGRQIPQRDKGKLSFIYGKMDDALADWVQVVEKPLERSYCHRKAGRGKGRKLDYQQRHPALLPITKKPLTDFKNIVE